jgi:mono/diheme cytochrome c family protein
MAAGSSRNRWFTAAVVAAVISLAALIGWFMIFRGPTTISAGTVDLDDARRIAAGRHIYDAQCATCHGTHLEGQPDWKSRRPDGRLPAPPHDDSGHTWHHPPDVLFAITKQGLVPPYAPADYATDMPAFGARLSDEEIWSVLAYIRSRWSDKIRAANAELERRFRANR